MPMLAVTNQRMGKMPMLRNFALFDTFFLFFSPLRLYSAVIYTSRGTVRSKKPAEFGEAISEFSITSSSRNTVQFVDSRYQSTGA